MPVHADLENGVLVITIDGDHTGSEFLRVGSAAMREAPKPIPIVMQLAGAAGLKGQPSAAAGLLEEYGDAISRVAVIPPANARRLPSGRMPGFEPFATHETQLFTSRDEALAWASGGTEDEE